MRRYIANLDGLRFLAATTVACSHLEDVKSYATDYSFHNRFIKNAPQISVTFFFVLSGFLIMWWFLEDTKGNVQKIDVKKFYLYRISRTWPLYFLLVSISLVVSIINGSFSGNEALLKRFALYFLFLPNSADIFYGPDVFLGPTWSLAVEEFFYLLFPLVLVQIPRNKLFKRLVFICFGTLLFSIALNPIFISVTIGDKVSLPGIVHYLNIIADRYRFYSFLLGAISSYLVFNEVRLPDVLKFIGIKQKIQLFSLLLLLLFLCGITFSFATQQIYSCLFALFLYTITRVNYSSKFLNCNFLKTGGKISYGIYMLHMLVVFRLVNQLNFLIPVQNKFLNIFVSWSLMLGLTYVISYISFYYFETAMRDKMRQGITIPVKNEN
ncbi:MAG: acyltransferase [Chitinophagaceae bacterium]|nr:MAG: acyltransferase [Chitinophagaceae bacterium]